MSEAVMSEPVDTNRAAFADREPEADRGASESAAVRAERLRAFGEAIDRIGKDARAKVGAEDVRHVKRLDTISHALMVAGRVLIHVSPEPVTFLLGVGALFVHKQLQAAEIGHTALHGTYDGLPGAERYQSKTFSWDTPIDEESWRTGHNVKHHGNTNVAGKDPDIHYGPIRLTVETPHAPKHRVQVPFAFLGLFPTFAFFTSWHFTGLSDVFMENGQPERFDVLKDRSPASIALAVKRAVRKYAPYYFVSYVALPALAGPMFWKVMLGNFLAETLRDVYSATTIFCGHVGEETASYPRGTRPGGRGEWYAMQVEASNDFAVPKPVSVLCGALDLQIEHHLFPTLPPERLRAIAPEVERACAEHGVRYRKESWGKTLRSMFRMLVKLSESGTPRDLLHRMA